jgi:hypothetical protein
MMEVEVDKHDPRGHLGSDSREARNHEEQPMLGPMHGATRCGAKTRRGTACQSPAVRGKRRCRMHGGAPGSGAPSGWRNGNNGKGQSNHAKDGNRPGVHDSSPADCRTLLNGRVWQSWTP